MVYQIECSNGAKLKIDANAFHAYLHSGGNEPDSEDQKRRTQLNDYLLMRMFIRNPVTVVDWSMEEK
jgi:hypothetical protein